MEDGNPGREGKKAREKANSWREDVNLGREGVNSGQEGAISHILAMDIADH